MHQHKLITLSACSVWLITFNPSIAYNRSISKIRILIGAIDNITRTSLNTQKTLNIYRDIIYTKENPSNIFYST